MHEIPGQNPEAVFVGPEGEPWTPEQYLTWELNEILRVIHEQHITQRLDTNFPPYRGLLLAFADTPDSELSVGAVYAELDDSAFGLDDVTTNLKSLVNLGILTQTEDRGVTQYSLTVSPDSWLDVYRNVKSKQLQRIEASRANRGSVGRRIGKLLGRRG